MKRIILKRERELAVLLSVTVVFISVLWQTLKAAKMNPAKEQKKSRMELSDVILLPM